MNLLNRISEKIKEDLSMSALIKLALVFLIVWLFQETTGIWQAVLAKLWQILKPFTIGFVIAYVLRYPIKIGEKYGVPRKVMIPLLYIVIILISVWILSSLVPMLIDRSGSFINSIIEGVNWLTKTLANLSEDGLPDWISRFMNNAVDILSDLKGLIPNLPVLLTQTLSALTTALISVILSVFMLFSWDKIRHNVIRVSRRISRKCFESIFAINEEVSDYVRSMLILMIIKAVEYSLLYFLIGNNDWLILGIMTALSLFVPYIGPTIVNCIGIVSSLTLALPNIIALIILILILSNVDEYVISPIVHARNTNITPLMALFSLFAGSALLGVAGIIIAIPAMLSIRVLIRKYSDQTSAADGTKEESTV
ncbi:MAG: AI-2E family transporter [Solobacterium sp.]|nr:AI-2E family transporter [Solobacterium sp.]